ncbi:MAG: hypothetical protein JOZ73_04610 [Solirubrobacterales bacterium]|nr:hypothetical protein [Solirubrobacterales bacterium]
MLQTVREYGLEQLAAEGEESAARARHAHYFEMLAERAAPHFLGPEQLVWLAHIDDEFDNLRVVLQWLLDQQQYQRGQALAGSLWYYWSNHGRVSEGRAWLTQLLAASAGRTPDQTCARALLALGLTAQKQYDIDACNTTFAECLDLARSAGDCWTSAMALVRLAWAMERSSVGHLSANAGRSETASLDPAEQYLEALAIFRRLGDSWGTALCLAYYAQFLIFRDVPRARQLATEAVEIAYALGERQLLGFSLSQLARLAMASGQPSRARRLLEQSRAASAEINDLYSECQRLASLAQLEVDADRFVDALAIQEQRAAKWRLLGSRTQLAHALHDLAIAARLTGDVDRARQAFDESLALSEALGQRSENAAARASLGHLHRQRGSFGLALATFEESQRILSDLNVESGLATVFAGLAALVLDAGQSPDAARLLGAAEALLERQKMSPPGEVNPSQWGLRGLQFRRDVIHVRELRVAAQTVIEQIGTPAFETAFRAGHALSTAEAIAVAQELAAQLSRFPDVV